MYEKKEREQAVWCKAQKSRAWVKFQRQVFKRLKSEKKEWNGKTWKIVFI